MTDFAQINANLTAAALLLLGQDGIYRPPYGEAKSVRVIVDRSLEIRGDHGEVVDRRVAVSLAKADVGELVGAEIETGGQTYVVDAPHRDDGEIVTVLVQ